MRANPCPHLIDVSRLVKRLLRNRLPTGIDQVALAYVRNYASCSRAFVRFGWVHTVLSKYQSQRLFQQMMNPCPDFRRQVLQILAVQAATAVVPPGVDGCVFFNIGHSGLEDRSYGALLRRMGVRPVFMVHDLIPLTHPEYSRPGEKDRHRIRMRTVLEQAQGVIANSRATLHALSSHAQEEGMPLPPAIVSHLAPHDRYGAVGQRRTDRPYFVVLGTIEPRKNHVLLLHAWRRLVEHMGDRAPLLVIIGQRGWECENVIDILERCDMLRGHVLEHAACTDAELADWLGHARALLFPTFTEGFGLPLVEALALGTPVIVSDLPVFSEIAGDIPDYLDPLDALGWMNLIRGYAEPDCLARKLQVQRISRFVVPTWKNHFNQVDAFLDRVVC